MPTTAAELPPDVRADAQTLWDYHQMGHRPRPTSVGIGLGSHDIGVASHTAELYRRGMFPLIVFTGANAPTTIERFPRGEAVHYREHALELGVPDDAIRIETKATSTTENIQLTRALLDDAGISIQSVTLISRPYQQRYAYGVTRKQWPEVEVICSSEATPMPEYMDGIGDADRVVNMLVGDVQRIAAVASFGQAIRQEIPADLLAAYWRLVDRGYASRVIPNVELSLQARTS